VSEARAAAIAAEYPLSAYPPTRPDFALSTLVSDASFACPALQVDSWTAARVPTYAYQFNDDLGKSLGQATHGAELPYLFDLPNSPFPVTLDPDQQALAASMRTDWARFALAGNPSSRLLPWPSFNGTQVLSLVPLQSQVTSDFAAAHHCSFWAAG
jgi:para-nitrobenzyl esterase